MKSLRWFAFFGTVYLAGIASAWAEYRLGTGDELRIMVAAQPQITGTYTVADDGAIFLVLGGKVSVGGLSVDAAALAIKASLLKYILEPDVALEINKYRPFYVMGDVANSGLYPSTPGMTAMKAVAAAGGLRGRYDSLESAVTSIRASESYLVALKQRLDGQVQLARLQAELEDAPTFEWDAKGLPEKQRALLDKAVSYEQELFKNNRDGFQKQIKILEDLLVLRTNEIEALKQRFEAQQQQTVLLGAEIARTEALLKNGIATIAQRNTLSREESRSKSDGLQIQLQHNQAQQGLNETKLQISGLTRDRRSILLEQIASTSQKLQRLGEEIKAAEALILETDSRYAIGRAIVRFTFTVRGKDGTAAEAPVDEFYVIQPGDVLSVNRVGNDDNTATAN